MSEMSPIFSIYKSNGHIVDITFLFFQGMRSVIVDLSTVPHLDFAACQVFTEIQKELDLLGCTLVLTNPQDSVYDTLIHAHILREGPFKIYASIHDAVLYLQHENNAIIA